MNPFWETFEKYTQVKLFLKSLENISSLMHLFPGECIRENISRWMHSGKHLENIFRRTYFGIHLHMKEFRNTYPGECILKNSLKIFPCERIQENVPFEKHFQVNVVFRKTSEKYFQVNAFSCRPMGDVTYPHSFRSHGLEACTCLQSAFAEKIEALCTFLERPFVVTGIAITLLDTLLYSQHPVLVVFSCNSFPLAACRMQGNQKDA